MLAGPVRRRVVPLISSMALSSPKAVSSTLRANTPASTAIAASITHGDREDLEPNALARNNGGGALDVACSPLASLRQPIRRSTPCASWARSLDRAAGAQGAVLSRYLRAACGARRLTFRCLWYSRQVSQVTTASNMVSPTSPIDGANVSR